MGHTTHGRLGPHEAWTLISPFVKPVITAPRLGLAHSLAHSLTLPGPPIGRRLQTCTLDQSFLFISYHVSWHLVIHYVKFYTLNKFVEY